MRAAVGDLTARLKTVDGLWVDTAVAAVLLLISLIDIWAGSVGGDRGSRVALACVIATGVAVRRRWPLQALALVALTFAAKLALDGWNRNLGPSGVEGSAMALLLFYGAGAYLGGVRAVVGLVIGIALTSASALSSHTQLVSNLVWDDLVLAVLPWFVARMVRARVLRGSAARERAERLDAEHEMHMRVAALAERARLAREIHDVIAHSVSVMVIQAAGARTVMDGEPWRAEEALLSVERAGREALAEMRRLLGVLGDGDHLRALAPQPGIADLEELIARTCDAGLSASISVIGEPVAVSPGLSLCAYRVVQEALTNTIKHAGAARAAVSVRWHADALELEVADDGHGIAAAGVDSGGHGIIGMRERAALHGGRVEIGPLPGGGFAVHARIPLAGMG